MRPTNKAICDRFRYTLTSGFYTGSKDSPHNNTGLDMEEALYLTREWRGELWKLFREIEDRLCPLAAGNRTNRDWMDNGNI